MSELFLEDSSSESYVNHLDASRIQDDFVAEQRAEQKPDETAQGRKEEKKLSWLNDEQEDIDRFIFGDCKSEKKAKESKLKKQANKEVKQTKKQMKQPKKETKKPKKSQESQYDQSLNHQTPKKTLNASSVRQMDNKSISKMPADGRSVDKKSNVSSVMWIHDDDFDDGINWSDDEMEKPDVPHESYFSQHSYSQVKKEKAPFPTQKYSKCPQKHMPKWEKIGKNPHAQNRPFSVKSSLKSLPSSHVKTKRSSGCKQPSIQLFSGFEQLSQEDDNQWFAEVKQEQPSMEEQERLREEQLKQRRDYQEYKRRLYRKKKMAQTRKIFEKHEIEQLKAQFEVFHNQEGSDEENITGKPRRVMIGLPKLTLKQLATRYGSSTGTINSLYREWRFDPTLSKPLSRFDRLFIVGIGNKPPRAVFARQRTQKRIQTLAKLLEENPFLSQAEMCAALQESEQYKEKIEHSGLMRVLKMGDFRRKRVKLVNGDRNSEESLAQRATYALHYRNFLARGFEVYFYDEMLINEYYDCDNGWTRGDQEIIFRPELLIHQSIVILGLLSGAGELLWDARFGDYAGPQLEEAIKGFMSAVHKKKGPSNKLLVINAIPYRNCKAMAALFEQHGWEIIYMPIHGLHLNPFFSFFAELRDTLRRKKTRNFEALFQQIVNYFRKSEYECLGYEHVNRLDIYLQRAQQHQHF